MQIRLKAQCNAGWLRTLDGVMAYFSIFGTLRPDGTHPEQAIGAVGDRSGRFLMVPGWRALYGHPMNDRTLLRGGALAGPLFVLIFLVLGAMRESYDAMRHPISSLALGPGGSVQVVNFVLAGALSLALAAGLWNVRKAGSVLIGVWGLGFLGTAFFTTDPVSGYPVGTPLYPVGTVHGMLHNLCALVAALAFVAACIVMARGWVAYSVGTAVVFIAALVVSAMGTAQTPSLVGVAGLFDRIAVITAFAWLTALALRTAKRAGQT